MKRLSSIAVFGCAIPLFAILLAGCDGLSKVGDQDNDRTPPTASVVALNQPFTSDASGKVTTRVRSGTEVFLSGKDSEGANVPVLGFNWSVVTPGPLGSSIKLITRNNSTVSFTAPNVATDTTVQLRLVITDANGVTAQKDIDVTVLAIPDGGHFLSYGFTQPRKLRLSAMASRNVTPAELTAGGDVSYEITLRELVDYTTPAVDGPYLTVATRTLTGKWLASYGISHDCDSTPAPQDPVHDIDVPALDVDDILAVIDQTNGALEPNPGLVDQFRTKLDVTIRVTGGTLPSGVTPLVCAPAVDPVVAPVIQPKRDSHGIAISEAVETDPASGTLSMTIEQMLGAASTELDTPASARAYFAAIDPQSRRTTLLDWLKVNGFLPATRTAFTWADLDAGSTTHGTYTNNFDLGFGRDMYARVGACSDGAAPTIGQPLDVARVGNCDVAAVVINYSSLEGASKKSNPLVAVAMEYTATPNSGGKRIVQFYTFAPDLADGSFKRVVSINLDGRGEKYMPQACTVCHGGTPQGLDANGVYRNAGDLGATFLPWDLDAFLFADAEGATADRSYGDATLRPRYTRTSQEEALRKLNQLTYLTYRDTARSNRFNLPKQLLEGWYGTQATPARAFTSTTFNSAFVPAGWSANGIDGQANTADDNPAAAPQLYRNVFARYCRACHIAHIPSPNASGASLETLVANNVTFNRCDAAIAPSEPESSGLPNQVPMGCYRELINAPHLAERLSRGEMPFARLTMDRFWVGPNATMGSAGDDLFDHLEQVYAALPPANRPSLTVPGTPSACFSGLSAPVQRGVEYPLDGSCSMFPQRYRWTLQAPTGSAATLAFADTPFAVLRGIDVKGNYGVTLDTAPNVTQAAAQPRVDNPIQVPTIALQTLSPAAGQNTRDIVVGATGGEGALSITGVASGNASVATAALVSGQTIRLTGVNVSADNVPVSFNVVDVDGDISAAAFNVSVKAGLTANSFTSSAATVRRTGTNGTSLILALSGQVTAVAGQALTFSVPATSALGGTLSVGASTGQVTYTPPVARMSQFRNGATVVGFSGGARSAPDSFTYTVRYTNDPGTTSSATVTVPIEGNSTSNIPFSLIFDGGAPGEDFENPCSGCHEFDGSTYFWFDANPKVTYCRLLSRSDSNQDPDFGAAYVNIGSPALSAIYRKPRGELNHQGFDQVEGTPTLHARILNWINEGAYYTSDGSQSCP